jgi:hypothetical protein
LNNEIEAIKAELEYYKLQAEKHKNKTYDLHTWAVFATVGYVGIVLLDLLVVIALLLAKI